MSAEMSPPVSQTENKGDDERLGSCWNCKKSKVKCVRPEGSPICSRCTQRKLECNAPLFHVGRHKGVKNKHSGLEKAVFQIEQALRRTSAGSEQIQNSEQATELRYLLERSRDLLSAERSHTRHNSTSTASNKRRAGDAFPSPQPSPQTPPSHAADLQPYEAGSTKVEDDQLNLDDAENPLQLLARTSELLSSIGQNGEYNTGRLSSKSLGRGYHPQSAEEDNIQRFFGHPQPRLDVGEDLDPIDVGLISLGEAEALFAFFYENLAHTRWGIDPELHTVDFVRKRSAFLFTSIVAASALFTPSLETLHRRLAIHRQKLLDLIMTKGFKSVEIVLAFMVNVPWISAGEHWADDESSTYLALATSISLDLYLDKMIVPPLSPSTMMSPISDNISARRALDVDGFIDVNPSSEWGRRLLRRRERTWLALFVLERGACLARGRSYMLPVSPLIECCDNWHLCDLQDRWDGSIVSVAVLRRDLEKLIANLRAICDSFANGASEGMVVEKLKAEITMFFDRWYQTWPLQIGDSEQFALPPYVEILASHTRLSMYSSVLNHGSAPVAARRFFRAAGLSSALNVLRVAVQGEGQLKSMPNNTAIMISFAAAFALRVSTVADGKGSRLAPSIRALIGETIEVLERVGSVPVQRKGLSCIFAGQLRQILQLAMRSSEQSRAIPENNGMMEPPPVYMDTDVTQMGPPSQAPAVLPIAGPNMNPDYFLFSTMSNDQLNEAINTTEVGLDVFWEDFQFRQASELDWMDWSTLQ
ncbi:hypothetical protein F5Y16DRAFT_357621 [Xylariaceae sp. FL0255]|nr:hypothetical protein F5Y16DRAFT_357621 [Xylariaceae sp. FL0255]